MDNSLIINGAEYVLKSSIPEAKPETPLLAKIFPQMVASYNLIHHDRHINGDILIVFVRKASRPDKPFCCLEISLWNNKIVQLRTFANQNPDKDVWEYAKSLCQILEAPKLIKTA